jgi:hypothetical protein
MPLFVLMFRFNQQSNLRCLDWLGLTLATPTADYVYCPRTTRVHQIQSLKPFFYRHFNLFLYSLILRVQVFL